MTHEKAPTLISWVIAAVEPNNNTYKEREVYSKQLNIYKYILLVTYEKAQTFISWVVVALEPEQQYPEREI